MDDLDGFFPERRVLAMRREQQRPSTDAPKPESKRLVLWIVLGTVFFPSWVVMVATGFKVPTGVLLVVCYGLAALAVAGVAIGGYRGLRSARRPSP